MNKKAQFLFYTLMLSIIILVLALAFAPIIKEFIMNTTNDMNCNNGTVLTEFEQANCYGWDISFWLFVALFIVLAFVVLGAKVIGG